MKAKGVSIPRLRGMKDLLSTEFRRHQFILDSAQKAAALYGFKQILTPILESTALFSKAMGEYSDVVSKEMFSFISQSGTSISLRPEGTAGICRMIANDGLLQTSLPQRFFYHGPMFRYERPQKGRQRQFHQVGVEAFGEASSMEDADVIACAAHFLQSLGVLQHTKLLINTLGNEDDRVQYKDALKQFLAPLFHDLSLDSQNRFEKGAILRILDSKIDQDKKIVAKAPVLEDFLSTQSKERHQELLDALKTLDIQYQLCPTLVRGLDYYSHTIFEFVTDHIGAQSAVLAGGRYDGLVEMFGGPKIQAVGWAGGVERLELLVQHQILPKPKKFICVLGCYSEENRARVLHKMLKVCENLRKADVETLVRFDSRSLGKHLRWCNERGASVLVLVQDTPMEPSNGTDVSILVKNLATAEQQFVTDDQLLNIVEPYMEI